MSHKTKMEKLCRIISSQIKKENVVEKLKPLEMFFNEGPEETEQCLYPNEANFQLPNVFLKTKTSGELKNFVKSHNKTTDYTLCIDSLLDVLDSIDFKPIENLRNKQDIKEEVVKFLVNNRKGGV